MNDANEVPDFAKEQPPIDFFDDMNINVDQVAGTTLERLTALANLFTEKDAERTKAAVALAELEEEIKNIQRIQIPNIMEELGVAEFKMADGAVVSVSPKINASIPEARRPDAFRWLEEHDYDGIIKTKVLAEFGKGEMDDAKKAQAALEKAGVFASLDRSIHNATLTSFVKERLAAGETLPDAFSVFEFKEAKIKAPKAKKK